MIQSALLCSCVPSNSVAATQFWCRAWSVIFVIICPTLSILDFWGLINCVTSPYLGSVRTGIHLIWIENIFPMQWIRFLWLLWIKPSVAYNFSVIDYKWNVLKHMMFSVIRKVNPIKSAILLFNPQKIWQSLY